VQPVGLSSRIKYKQLLNKWTQSRSVDEAPASIETAVSVREAVCVKRSEDGGRRRHREAGAAAHYLGEVFASALSAACRAGPAYSMGRARRGKWTAADGAENRHATNLPSRERREG
jgi:hypothetical protein